MIGGTASAWTVEDGYADHGGVAIAVYGPRGGWIGSVTLTADEAQRFAAELAAAADRAAKVGA